MIQQYPITLSPKNRGFHIITDEVFEHIPELPKAGIFHIYIKHTSAAITINEAADPDVLSDFESFMNKIVPEHQPFLLPTIEGPDDMPAHVKASLIGTSISIPITNHKVNLGTWQGIYLCEFRNRGGTRKLIATIYQ